MIEQYSRMSQVFNSREYSICIFKRMLWALEGMVKSSRVIVFFITKQGVQAPGEGLRLPRNVMGVASMRNCEAVHALPEVVTHIHVNSTTSAEKPLQ